MRTKWRLSVRLLFFDNDLIVLSQLDGMNYSKFAMVVVGELQ